MGQITSGLRAFLSHPAIYDGLQNLFGAHAFRVDFARQFVCAEDRQRVLDLGCGTAEILDYLPDVIYHGFDVSEPYISSAKKRFSDKGHFESRILNEADAARGEKFDIALALGVLHHLDDEVATSLLKTAFAALKPGGRFVSFDPVFSDGQNWIARYLISKDRGQNVRDETGYRHLAERIFPGAKTSVKHRAWIPYSHCFIEATKR